MNIKVYKLSNGGGDYSTAAKTSDCEEVELFVSPQENLKTCFWCGSINSNVNIFFFPSQLLELNLPTFPSRAGLNLDVSYEQLPNQKVQRNVVLWGKRSLIYIFLKRYLTTGGQ